MYAIVLSCDRYRTITEHMIRQYGRLWPDHEFRFRIPYQELPGEDSAQRQYIRTPAAIKATVLRLLEDLDDEEWVYWCVDDKYPIELVVPRIGAWLARLRELADMSALLFCRCRTSLKQPALVLYPGRVAGPPGEFALERRSWSEIWIHQFMKVKVIRYLFLNLPDDIPTAKTMDYLVPGITRPAEFRLLVTESNLAVFGESTTAGLVTRNCLDSMKASGIDLPGWFATTGRRITMGKL